jgi:hypothetical protein
MSDRSESSASIARRWAIEYVPICLWEFLGGIGRPSFRFSVEFLMLVIMVLFALQYVRA